jgi:hypothetical protein
MGSDWTLHYSGEHFLRHVDGFLAIKSNRTFSCYRLSGRESALFTLAFHSNGIAVIGISTQCIPSSSQYHTNVGGGLRQTLREPMLMRERGRSSTLISSQEAQVQYKREQWKQQWGPNGKGGTGLSDHQEPSPLLSQQATLERQRVTVGTGGRITRNLVHARQHQFVTLLLVAGSALD